MIKCLVVFCAIAACGDDDSGGGGGAALPDSGSTIAPCDQYLDCVLIASPSSYGAALELYGDSSECWKTAEQTMKCGVACQVAYEQIKSQCKSAECIDPNEPNNDQQHATAITYYSLDAAICPANELDFWALDLFGDGGITITLLSRTGSPAAIGTFTLRNASGTPIAFSSDGKLSVGASTAGRFYIEVSANAPFDYTIEFTEF
jgi:hypothetical protein